MAKMIIVYWRDIPAQVIVQRGRAREKVQLSHRFQEAIDRAAMRAGKGSSDAYLEEWRRESSVCDASDDLRARAAAEAARFESEYSDDRLQEMIRNHGSAGD